MNNKLNHKVRPIYYQLTNSSGLVLGICCLDKSVGAVLWGDKWTKISEQEYRYLSQMEERSKVIGATK